MPVPCKQCWRCNKNRVDGYVGRAMAEANTSSVCCTLTLTYAPRSDLADKILHPRHFQLFMKQLRRSGHKVRYLVAGEYGDLKGRAHFHAILFFSHLEPLGERGVVPRYKDDYPEGITQDDAPFCREIPQERMVHIREWPHGHIKADWSASQKSIRYVCKYILADDKNTAWFSLSKKPAIGAEWFARKAEKAKELGVLPSSFNYLPPGADRQRPYYMTGATRRDYLNAITQDSADRSKMNEWVRNTFDKFALQRAKDGAFYPPTDQFLEYIKEEIDRFRPSEKDVLSKILIEDYYDEDWHLAGIVNLKMHFLGYERTQDGFKKKT